MCLGQTGDTNNDHGVHRTAVPCDITAIKCLVPEIDHSAITDSEPFHRCCTDSTHDTTWLLLWVITNRAQADPSHRFHIDVILAVL